MFLAFLLLAFLLSCLEAREHVSCPKDFQCPSLGRMSFPFTNFSGPDCGLCLVNCDSRPFPKVQLSRSSDQIFDAISKTNNSIKVKDLQLQRYLFKQSCQTFYYEIYLPNSSSVSFKITSNTLTLFRCSATPNLSQEFIDKFNFSGYRRNTSCDGLEIFYRNPKNNYSQPELPPPTGCMAIHLPMRPRNNFSKENELFELLSSEFDLEWHVNPTDVGKKSQNE